MSNSLDHLQIPAVVLVRGNSKRLPGKWKLPWLGKTLLIHCIEQLLQCRYVSHVVVGSDSEEILKFAQVYTSGVVCALYDRSVQPVQTCLRPPVPDTQSSLEGLRYVQRKVGLSSSYILLAQCTSPFCNPADLCTLIETWASEMIDLKLHWWQRYYLARPQGECEATGMGYIIPPFATEDSAYKFYGRAVKQLAPTFDIDTEDDYKAAVKHTQAYDWFKSGIKNALPPGVDNAP